MIMKKISVIMLAVAAMVCMVSCKKDDNGTPKTFTAKAERSKEAHKVSLSDNTLLWSAVDSIRIYDNASHCGNYILHSGAGTNEGTFMYSSGTEVSVSPYKAVYPARFYTGSSQVTLPNVQSTTDGSLHELPMYATGASEDLSFYNICGVVRFRLTAASNVSLKSIAVTTNVATNGAATISGSGSSTTIGTPNGTTTTTLMCETAQNIASAHDFYMYLPAGDYTTFSILMTTSSRSTCTKNARGTITVQRGMISTITLTGLTFEAPSGVLPGAFSVANGRTVHFSQGNLQYIGSAGTPYWKFADHQYDCLGTTSQRNAGENIDRDLFGWGTSGYHDETDSHNTNYQPYSTSSNLNIDGTNYYGYGPSTNMTDNNLTGTSVNYDWCYYNAIQNGGNAPGMWRTLTNDEWTYLLTGRTNAALKVGYATVAGVHGIILLPDSFTDPMKNNGSGAFAPQATTGWDANVYTADNWTAMELAGAVFLPAAGQRPGVGYQDYDEVGYYWSTTHASNSMSLGLRFTNSITDLEGYLPRFHGQAVRAVRD